MAAMAPWKDKNFLYEHYVRRRMKMVDIVALIQKNYNMEVSHQTVWNWCKKYDLLKYRGKGRNLSANTQGPKRGPVQKNNAGKMGGMTPAKARQEQIRRANKNRKRR